MTSVSLDIETQLHQQILDYARHKLGLSEQNALAIANDVVSVVSDKGLTVTDLAKKTTGEIAAYFGNKKEMAGRALHGVLNPIEDNYLF